MSETIPNTTSENNHEVKTSLVDNGTKLREVHTEYVDVKPTVLGVIKSNPKTATGVITFIAGILGYYGLDLTLFSPRTGPEFWKNEDGIYKSVDAADLSQDDTILRIDWKGTGREIKSLRLFRVNNEQIEITKKDPLHPEKSKSTVNAEDLFPGNKDK
jgi:hypothetical protein